MDYQTARNQLLLGDISNAQWLKDNGYFLEYAYSLVLSANAYEALPVLDSLSASCIRADWLRILVPVLTNAEIEESPSFMQVRNFLEIDLTLLLKMKDTNYASNLINHGSYFFDVCKESYKFIGRALYYKGLREAALKCFLFAKDKFYQDAELHYLLSKFYLEEGSLVESQKAIKTCLRFIPDYKPALKILAQTEGAN